MHEGTASRAPTMTLTAGFASLYPALHEDPAGLRGHDGAWPSDDEHGFLLSQE
jgi:hypothetical protein